MPANRSSTKKQSVPERIIALATELSEARFVEPDPARARRLGAELAPLLETAYWSYPEVFGERQVRSARSFVAWLKKARYINSPRSMTLRGGAPGLGKRA